ncbi:hypothetical protein QOZ80_6AG0521480 [Eleusine coracana subsp. coracana]|nr:hypothetical protein QOZ80_6AG0521480 [Eleusine coracana subsp. coracana]
MEVFDGARFVRLRCVERRGKYAAADVDGLSVCLSGQRLTHNTVWAVEHAQGPDGPSVLLRSAYGRYLFTIAFPASTGSPEPVLAAQSDLEQDVPPPGMLWHAVHRGGAFVLRCGLGRYLRANGRYRRWRREITIVEDDHSTMMQWAIENVPVKLTRPTIHDDILQLTHRHRSPATEVQMTRRIRAVQCQNNGYINEAAWRVMEIRNNNLIHLRITLASRFGLDFLAVTNTIVCIRAGRFGVFSPLHIDLPIANNGIDLVLITHGTLVGNSLVYPDLDAPQ